VCEPVFALLRDSELVWSVFPPGKVVAASRELAKTQASDDAHRTVFREFVGRIPLEEPARAMADS
jgi:hypothetical protein